jgi:hypothetical protein
VGPWVGVDAQEKFRTAITFDPRTVQPVAIRYSDCAIPAAIYATPFHFSSTI